ncbi:MAG: DUF350 domain-containing protein, partial [Plesiomonas shigelloides]
MTCDLPYRQLLPRRMTVALLAGLGSFALYFFTALIMLMVFKWAYVRVTPYDEWALVKEQKNVAAAVTLAGAF